MKKLLTAVSLFSCLYMQAQMGIGTTSPNSTLDVRGSLSTPVTTFTGNTTAGSADNFLVFTGTSAATLTLPTAVGITGREYWIKNASSNSSTLTIATTSSQTVDGIGSWSLTQANKVIRFVSNGTNWYAASESLPGNSAGTAWIWGGNNVSSLQNLGTTSNYSLPIITNNTERMRVGNTGNVAIGTTSWNGSNPEKLLVDAGTTSSINVISGKGSLNNYLQLNIQNTNSGGAASSDIVATADNGNETVNYVDLGINSSGYGNSGVLGGANNAYLYSAGNDFIIGNATSGRNLVFFTGGTATTNERMRVDANGNVGIGTTSPSTALHVVKNNSGANVVTIQNSNGSGYSSLDFLNNSGTLSGTFGYANGSTGAPFTGRTYFNSYGNDFVLANNTTAAFLVDGPTNCVGIGTTTFNGSNPERLIVDAGSGGSSYQNVIVGKGNTNSYAQLNIQNTSNGASASSDVVATADNGTESVNFIDMGINGGSNTSTGVLGGANRAYLYTTGQDFSIGNATSGEDIIFFTGGTAAGNERMRLTSAGHLVPGANNTYNLGSTSLRWATIYSQNALNTSDARLKTNIRKLNYGLSSILRMHPVQYNWKEGDDKDGIGFLAQELRNVIPEIVVGDESKETLAVNYIELIPVLVNAIKEQQQQIDVLKKKIAVLENK